LISEAAYHVQCSLTRKVKAVNFHTGNFGSFSFQDLERLKDDDKWLSDSHVTLGLRYFCFFSVFAVLKEAVIVLKTVSGVMFGGR
jgi:hypothetical protein